MTKPWVLVVEDEADIYSFVRMALEKEGLNIAEAKTAQEARIDSACRRPELVIVDLGLADGDGKTFIRELRAWSSNQLSCLPLVSRNPRRSQPSTLEPMTT